MLPECCNIVAGGPAHHKAPLWARAPLIDLVQVACRPHLAHTHLSLPLKVVGWSGNMETKVQVSLHRPKKKINLLQLNEMVSLVMYQALTWLCWSPVCLWRGRGVCLESASLFGVGRVHGGGTTYQSQRGKTGPMSISLGTQEAGSSLWKRHMSRGKNFMKISLFPWLNWYLISPTNTKPSSQPLLFKDFQKG